MKPEIESAAKELHHSLLECGTNPECRRERIAHFLAKLIAQERGRGFDWKDESKRPRVQVKTGWDRAKRKGIQVGEPVFVEQWWVPVLWDDEDDPDFFKEAGLDGVVRAAAERREVSDE